MANQESIISYVPQPFFDVDLTVASMVGYDSVASIENSTGVFSPDLSDYATVNPTSGVEEFAVQIDFDKSSAHLSYANVTLALVGCSLLTYEDSGGNADLTTEFPESIACLMSTDIGTVSDELISYAHNSDDSVFTFDKIPMPSIISGGRSNLVFHGLGAASAGASASVYVTIQRKAADVLARPHAKLIIGHLFVGIDLVITLDPRTFAWSLTTENDRFVARDWGAVHSDGTLVKRSLAEVINIPQSKLIGSTITDIATEIDVQRSTNFFDLVKSATSYPLLLNPYPVGPIAVSTVTVDDLNLSLRSNFFAIYGFMPDPLEVQTDDYRNQLDSLYRARLRLEETR